MRGRSNRSGMLYGSPGNYDYQTTFAAPAGVTSVTLTGQWASDDAGTDIRVNGVSSVLTNSGFSAWTSFRLTEPVIDGAVNTLDFIVNNAGTSDNPTGLRVEFSAVTFIPEPATGSAVFLGVLGLLARQRRGVNVKMAAEM